eukprot:2764487-Prymnesium_polylepis.1
MATEALRSGTHAVVGVGLDASEQPENHQSGTCHGRAGTGGLARMGSSHRSQLVRDMRAQALQLPRIGRASHLPSWGCGRCGASRRIDTPNSVDRLQRVRESEYGERGVVKAAASNLQCLLPGK